MKHLINQRLVSINDNYYHHYNVKVIVEYLGRSGVPKLLCEEPVKILMILAMNQYVHILKHNMYNYIDIKKFVCIKSTNLSMYWFICIRFITAWLN